MFIGVDVDQYISVPGNEDIMLSSVLKRMDNAVFDAIETAMGLDGSTAWPETLYVGTLANEGVGMAPFHDFEDAVSQELKDEIAALQTALIDGTVTADAFSGQPPASAAP
jgi:basic membrane protein A